jgi:putative hydrolase of the HAD superfamily
MSRSLDFVRDGLPDALLVDLDNTLYPYEPAHTVGMSAAASRCEEQLGLDAKAFREHFDAARREVKEQVPSTAAAHSRLLYFQRLIEKTTGKSDPALSLDLEKTYWRRFMSAARLFPGARELIEECRFHRIPIALVTDLTAQIQMRKLVYFELDNAFDMIVTSEETGTDKPDARMFELALRKLGRTAATTRTWMIGDDEEKDIRGAKAAVNAVTIQKLHAGVVKSSLADAHVHEFAELTAAIREQGRK